MARSNQWIEFVRMYAKHFGLSYMCAISSQDIKQDYKDWKAGKVEFGSTKYRNGKELKPKKPKTKYNLVEEEDEEEEIIPVPKKKKVKKSKPKVELIEEDDEEEEIIPVLKKKKSNKVPEPEAKQIVSSLIEEEEIIPAPKKVTVKKDIDKRSNLEKELEKAKSKSLPENLILTKDEKDMFTKVYRKITSDILTIKVRYNAIDEAEEGDIKSLKNRLTRRENYLKQLLREIKGIVNVFGDGWTIQEPTKEEMTAFVNKIKEKDDGLTEYPEIVWNSRVDDLTDKQLKSFMKRENLVVINGIPYRVYIPDVRGQIYQPMFDFITVGLELGEDKERTQYLKDKGLYESIVTLPTEQ